MCVINKVEKRNDTVVTPVLNSIEDGRFRLSLREACDVMAPPLFRHLAPLPPVSPRLRAPFSLGQQDSSF